MGNFWSLEEIERLKNYMKDLLKDFKVNSLRDIIFALIILGQYIQYAYYDMRVNKVGNKYYSTGAGVVYKNCKIELAYKIANCRNTIIHPSSNEDVFNQLRMIHELLINFDKETEDWVSSLELDIRVVITCMKQSDKEWKQLFDLLSNSDSGNGFDDAMKMLGMK